MREAAREKRDLAVEKLRKRYAPKLKRLEQKIRTAEDRLAREQSQYKQQKMQTAISVGATVLGALFGRKVASVGTVGRASTAMRGAGRAARERQDVQRATEQIAEAERQLVDLSAEFEAETEKLRDSLDPSQFEISEKTVRPRKTDISIDNVALAWTPWIVSAEGIAERAF